MKYKILLYQKDNLLLEEHELPVLAVEDFYGCLVNKNSKLWLLDYYQVNHIIEGTKQAKLVHEKIKPYHLFVVMTNIEIKREEYVLILKEEPELFEIYHPAQVVCIPGGTKIECPDLAIDNPRLD